MRSMLREYLIERLDLVWEFRDFLRKVVFKQRVERYTEDGQANRKHEHSLQWAQYVQRPESSKELGIVKALKSHQEAARWEGAGEIHKDHIIQQSLTDHGKDCSLHHISNSSHERIVCRTVWYVQVSLATVWRLDLRVVARHPVKRQL